MIHINYKKKKNGIKSLISKVMILLILITTVPLEGLSFSVLNAGDNILIENIRFVREHNGFTTSSAYIEITGSGLSGANILFEKIGVGGGFQKIGSNDSETSNDGFIKYTFTKEETLLLSGNLRIGNKTINLDLGDFPTLSSVDKEKVNITKLDDLVLTGTNLQNIKLNVGDTTKVKAEYGRTLTKEFFYNSSGTDNSNRITLVDPQPPENNGLQNIKFSRLTNRDNGTPADSTDDYSVDVAYVYASGFKFIEDLGLTNIEMFPNVGNVGDLLYIDADEINDTKEYSVYFIRELDSTDTFTDQNKAEFISIENNNTGKDRLTVRVPNLATGNYRVFVTNTLNGEVVAEQLIMDGSSPALYTIVQSTLSPSIKKVTPSEGPDSGQDIQLDVTNLLTVALPDLTVPAQSTFNYTGENFDKTLKIDYGFDTSSGNIYVFKGKEVIVTRKIKVIIGNETKFVRRTDNTFIATKGNPDTVVVNSGVFTDAELNPQKDIKIEVITTLEEATNGVKDPSGKTYTFKQEAFKSKGYTAIPSTLTPEINKITPEKIQIKSTNNTMQNAFQFTIKGSKFIVDRYIDSQGKIILKYPTILFKQNGGNTLTESYQLGFFPNVVNSNTIGQIKWKTQDDNLSDNLIMNGADPQTFDIKVVDDNNKIVDGTDGNSEGTKIILTIPENAYMHTTGVKSVQVINVRRGSTDYGFSSVLKDSVEFVKTTDIPVIESVIPNIVTVDGGDEIIVRGSNFQDGIKLYLDGEEITGFDREIDPQGDKILLKFKAPTGREGETQIMVVNPSGGSDVYAFIYVRTFAKDPILTNFSPTQGTEGTYVMVNGDNFLKPDPTASSLTGYEGFRLIGTRIYLDGKDINTYNRDSGGNITFNAYTSPNSEKFISTKFNLIDLTKFKNNIVIKGSDNKVYYLENDKDSNPRITDYDNISYTIKYESGAFKAYDLSNNYIADVTITDSLGTDVNYANDGITKLKINSATPFEFTITMDNKVLRQSLDSDGNKIAAIADYADSVILTDGSTFFTLTKDLNDNIKLSNGKDAIYTVTYDTSANKFIGKKTELSPALDVTVTNSGLTIGVLSLTFITPYDVDSASGKIVGNRTKVITKDQIGIYIPKLFTGKGYKDIKVVNPDTKSASKTGNDGFYYVTQSSSHPVITEIKPNKGSVDGGYNITIYGKEFEDDIKVYIDSVLVPESDRFTSIDGTSIVIKVPKSMKNLREDYNVDKFTVPVLVINNDGGNAYRELGFTYIIPVSSPSITRIIPVNGSSNGGEIVEIFGYEFRYYEPYIDTIGGPNYDLGDEFEDLFANGVWDDLLSSNYDPNALKKIDDPTISIFGYYYESDILPTIYFGEKTAKIVEFSKGYIKVIAPPHDEEAVDVYVVNNDLGITNKMTYTYTASNPKLTQITPNKGKKSGQERKELYGSSLFKSQVKGYGGDDVSTIKVLADVQAMIRFGNITNLNDAYGTTNYGQINNQIASIGLTGGLKVEYRGATNQIIFTHEENGKIYTRTFENYDDTTVFIPMEMLKNSNTYYVPNGLRGYDGTSYSGTVFEYVKVYIKDKRLIAERGYAPKVTYDNTGHVTLSTPSYYTIDPVDVTYFNTDGGKATITFTYTNPDSLPKILKVEPNALSADKTYYMVEGSTVGGIEIEVLGLDFREGATVSIGNKSATVVDLTTKQVDNVIYDVLIIKVPAGSATDIDQKYSIIVENPDSGLASSSTIDNLIGPNYESTTIPFYFIYRKPLSLPTIKSVTPSETSVAGGNQIIITGADFRAGAIVIIGAKGGIPVTNLTIENDGTVIKFNTPTGLTLGDKTVQVKNADFGLASLENGLKIVSAPTVTGEFRSKDGLDLVHRISIEGGQEIQIIGTGFREGAKVIFGGTRIDKKETTSDPYGLYINDKYYAIEGGTEATSVKYIDSRTLLVTTPELKLEEDQIVTVINDDIGISDSSATIKFTEPIPSDPIGLKARIMNERYVQLYDYSSDSVEYYEIYYYLGNKSAETLLVNKYQDFKYLDITNLEPYVVKEIPGYEKREKTDRLWFVLKAVNKFGPSNYSNIAYIDWKILEEVKEIGPVDEDGKIGVPDWKDYGEKTSSNTVTATLGNKNKEDLFISLVEYDVNKYPVREVVMPKERVSSDNSLITVDYGDSKMQFMPINLNTTEFRQVYDDGSIYGKIANNLLQNSYTAMAKGQIPRGFRAASKVYQIDFAAISQSNIKKLSSIMGNVDLEIEYNQDSLGSAKESTIGMYYFNGNAWIKVSATLDVNTNKVSSRIEKPGMYVLLISTR